MHDVFRSGSKKQVFDIVVKASIIHQSGGTYYCGSIHLLQGYKQINHCGNVASTTTQCSQLHHGCQSCTPTRKESFQKLPEFFGHFRELTKVTVEEV